MKRTAESLLFVLLLIIYILTAYVYKNRFPWKVHKAEEIAVQYIEDGKIYYYYVDDIEKSFIYDSDIYD